MSPAAVSGLANYFSTYERTIIDAWIQAVKSDPEIPSAQKLTPVELSDHLPALFDDLIDYLQTSAPEAARERVRQEAHHHGGRRWNQGYQLIELLRELGTVQRLLLVVVCTAFLSSIRNSARKVTTQEI
jgi:RsbT co-antagonist protein rsbRD N-terminal domain